MGKILRQINRGVTLGIVLLIGLIIFFVMDSAAFAAEEPALKDFLDTFLEDCEKVNLLPEQYREQGSDVPDEVIDAKTEEAKEFVEKYFTEYKRGQYYNSVKENMLYGAGSVYKENKITGDTIKDLQYSLVNISSIQKQSTNAVRIRFTVNMNINASPDSRFLNLTNVVWGFGHGNMTDQEVQNTSAEMQYTVTLFKVNGEWKIADSQGGYFFGNERRVVVQSGGVN